MPINDKGKKIMMSMKKQYGKKKGEDVFYAMENSGKLKKVLKAKGGKDASKADFTSTNTNQGSDHSHSRFEAGSGYYGGNKTTSGNGGSDNKFSKSFTKAKNDLSNLLKGPTPFASFNLVNNLIFAPITKANRTRRARGNMIIGGKKMPITRDYYRTTGKPLDVMSKEGIQYQKDAGLITDRKTTNNESAGGSTLCPDGTLPPCKAKVTVPTIQKPSTSNFLENFKAYNSGGVSSGPPPKKGPNSQVPPIKMKKGKMNSMTCPHRPDGIRGMGAAIKGSKFIGVK